jgi:hypothetical protein
MVIPERPVPNVALFNVTFEAVQVLPVREEAGGHGQANGRDTFDMGVV